MYFFLYFPPFISQNPNSTVQYAAMRPAKISSASGVASFSLLALPIELLMKMASFMWADSLSAVTICCSTWSRDDDILAQLSSEWLLVTHLGTPLVANSCHL